MKRNKILMFTTAALVAMLATGCQKSGNSAKVSSSTGSASVSENGGRVKSTTHSVGNLSDKNLSPKQTVAVVTAYAAKRYGDDWADLLKDANKTNLEVDFLNRSKYPKLNKGQGYIYDVGSKDYTYETRYTIDGDGSSQVIYMYDGDDCLGRSTISEMVKYLNKINCDSLVDNLATNAVIGGESSGSDDDNSADSSDSDDKTSSDSKKDTSKLPGDAGLYSTPGDMRGSWTAYNDDTELTLDIDAHSISTDDGDIELHKKRSGFDSSKLDADKYSDYGCASTTDVSGMQGVAVSGWTQSAGAHEIYVSTTAKGQPVILDLSSAGRLQSVYWKSKSLAEKYKGKTFDSLDEFKDWSK